MTATAERRKAVEPMAPGTMTDAMAADLLPRSLDDYRRRRSFILSRGAFPLVLYDDDRPPPLDMLEAEWIGRPGPDFHAAAMAEAGDDYEPIVLTGLRGKKLQEAKARNMAAAMAQRPHYLLALEYLYVLALYDPMFCLPSVYKGTTKNANFVSGTFREERSDRRTYGPSPADVMVVGKFPGMVEVEQARNFVGPSSVEFTRALEEANVREEDISDWYLTNFVKHASLHPSGSGDLAADWVKNSAPLVNLELQLVRPKFVLAFGAESTKRFVEAKANPTKMYGRVVSNAYETHEGRKEYLAVASIHPAYVSRTPEVFPDLANQVGLFWNTVAGKRTPDTEADIHHVCIYTERHLRKVVDEIIAESGKRQAIAVDCEWHGKNPGEPGSYLRTIQFSHKPKHAWCVVLRSKGGGVAFRNLEGAKRQLTRLLKSTEGRKVRIGGHFFRADLPWLMHFGIDARDEYRRSNSWQKSRDFGGWDTGAMAHAVREKIEGGYKLENLASRYVGVPRYDMALQAWKDRYCSAMKLKDKELEGYGECPDAVLHPYALYDVDATIRLFYYYNGTDEEQGALDYQIRQPRPDVEPTILSNRKPYWIEHSSSLAKLEMEMVGVGIDRERGDKLTQVYAEALDAYMADFRRMISWPTFNFNSAPQCRELLFGHEFNGSIDKVTGKPVRYSKKDPNARPPCLRLTPIKASGDKAPTWDRVLKDGQTDVYAPSTDKESLGILSHVKGAIKLYGEGASEPYIKKKGDIVRDLRNIRFLGQVLKGTLRRPYEIAGEAFFDEEDQFIYDGGLMYWIDHDGRVRTHFYPVETGRESSSRPNLQNISKRREEDYARILGDRYLYPIRSMIRAKPGHVWIEADYKMAEMALIGWLAQDKQMMEHVRRNTLKSHDPDFIDLHCYTAFNAFKLDTPENRAKFEAAKLAKPEKFGKVVWGWTKKVLEAIGKTALRVAAKNVNFGVPYQRSAEAIARQCREEGADVSIEDAQFLIDNYMKTYPQIAEYLNRCMARVTEEGWMAGTFNRHRRFERSDDQSVIAEMERSACNFPIQNGVADAIKTACDKFYEFRRRHKGPETFTMCLQIHDALLFEVPVAHVAWMMEKVIPLCMKEMVEIWPTDLNGDLLEGIDKPYHLDIDAEVQYWWGEELEYEHGIELGVPAKYLPEPKKAA